MVSLYFNFDYSAPFIEILFAFGEIQHVLDCLVKPSEPCALSQDIG